MHSLDGTIEFANISIIYGAFSRHSSIVVLDHQYFTVLEFGSLPCPTHVGLSKTWWGCLTKEEFEQRCVNYIALGWSKYEIIIYKRDKTNDRRMTSTYH
ncbi:hypothetical protein CEXT_156671 [Caerostris extrusa]|uniref:Uncharacterized protein n=1 Tax=Caerostris extrusa TaxID=172846 RepID=A0AAV4W7E1_CAEEX|nr:hypothetical protein CEXT_156671 [Caerostris extrusa]